MLLKGKKESRQRGIRTYRGPCRKMQAMSATFLQAYFLCWKMQNYVIGIEKVCSLLAPKIASRINGLFHNEAVQEFRSEFSGGIYNGFPKFLSLSKTLKNETQQLKNNGGIFFPQPQDKVTFFEGLCAFLFKRTTVKLASILTSISVWKMIHQ